MKKIILSVLLALSLGTAAQAGEIIARSSFDFHFESGSSRLTCEWYSPYECKCIIEPIERPKELEEHSVIMNRVNTDPEKTLEYVHKEIDKKDN